MSDSDEEFTQETQTTNNELEDGRVARLFLYKSRERQSVRRQQLKPVLDEYREKSRAKRRDPIKSASKLLTESIGLQIVDGLAPGEKPSQSGKNFLVRTHKYPKDVPLPFTVQQKQEFGLLTLCFFIVYFKGDLVDMDQLWQILENSGVPAESDTFGKLTDLLNKWISQDYFKSKKKENDTSAGPKKVISLGPRFYAEFGNDVLMAMAKELVCDVTPPEEDENNDGNNIEVENDTNDEHDRGEYQERTQLSDSEDSIEEVPQKKGRNVREQQKQKQKQKQKKKGRREVESD
ncbi:hypothetical protein TRFO_15228 [Tritrichomonas foetus]|uniref:MAGE domain-containing protein n=1 Tax=Tritrichomonas foetus TaxID=1144522 RepID=A0A1J4KT54_9EUKA|nr:hypothetical protein TRFO_15228 [Tritrichomonas foetus]|eukprot:OHT14435.1 hypothetical protein TRFO_15228 [Tritrichomonas foetus]